MIKGQSSREVLRNTVGNLRSVPSFAINRFRRRDPRSWVFGNIHGFRDSPRYLAEHILHSNPDLTVHWIAHEEKEAEAARGAGLNVFLRGDDEAKRIQRRAGAAFFTHGFRDLDLPQLSGAYLVFLWHGTPLKRIGLDVGQSRGARRSLRFRAAAAIVRRFQARAFRLVKLFVAASELDQARFMTAFGTTPERVKVLGSPRFDVIRGGPEYHRVAPGDLRTRLGVGPRDYMVLWLPTHRREYGDAHWLPPLTAAETSAALEGTNVKFLVKPHPRADWDVYQERLPMHPQIMLLEPSDVDVNAMLHIADALVTDYSSVVSDYIILGRPVEFFAPDIEQYGDHRGLYDPYTTLTGDREHSEWRTLLNAVRADSLSEPSAVGNKNAQWMATYCGPNTEPDSCRRIVSHVVQSITRK